MAKYATGGPLDQVSVVAGDGFFDEDIISQIDFPNARFILDHFHLLDSGLKKIFGKVGYDLLKGHLIQMVKAPSQVEFDSTLQSAQHLFAVQP